MPTTCKRCPASGCTENSVDEAGRGATPLRGGLAVLSLLTLGAMLPGCVAPPDISIDAVDVVEVGESTVELAIRVVLENREDVPVKLDMWDYHLDSCSGRYQGRWSAGLTIPPNETVRTSIPAVVPGGAMGTPSCTWRSGGSVTFMAPSRLAEVLFELGLNRPSASFSGTGDALGRGGPVPVIAPIGP